MKAAILEKYDKNRRDLKVRDVPVPDMSDGEVLVKIHTAGVNPLDNMIIRGEVKLIVPYQFPLIMGNEFAGVIEKTGPSVTGFSAGDRVYGRMPLGKIGAFAEYAAVDYRAVAKIPEYLTDEERAQALGIYEGLKAAKAAFEAGERSVMKIRDIVVKSIVAARGVVQYVEIASQKTLLKCTGALGPEDKFVILVAAFFGKTRLIDNIELN